MADTTKHVAPTLLGKETLHKGKRISLVRQTIEYPQGTVVRDVVEHPGAVVVLALTDAQEVIMVNQYRSPLDTMYTELPAGTLGAGEDPLAAAKREFQEETGYQASEWKALGELVPAPGFCDERLYCFFASGLTLKETSLEPDEHLVVERWPIAKVAEQAASGALIDAKTLSLLLRASLQGFIQLPQQF